jgi:hypothetical protein
MKFQNRILILAVCCLAIVNCGFLKKDDATKDNSKAFDSKTSPIEEKKTSSYASNKKKEGETKEEHANTAKVVYNDPSGKLSIPGDIQAPVLYNGPPNFEKRSDALEPRDDFNPSNRPAPIADEYPYYDAFPPLESFWEGKVVPLKVNMESSNDAKIAEDLKKKEDDKKDRKVAPQRKLMSESEMQEQMEKELAHLKKELFNGDESKIKKIRESKQAYDSKWLRSQLKITRVLELEDFIANKKAKLAKK